MTRQQISFFAPDLPYDTISLICYNHSSSITIINHNLPITMHYHALSEQQAHILWIVIHFHPRHPSLSFRSLTSFYLLEHFRQTVLLIWWNPVLIFNNEAFRYLEFWHESFSLVPDRARSGHFYLKSLVVIKCIKETPTEPDSAASIAAMCWLGMGQNKNTCSNMWESPRF